ncbi:MAG TPA: DNA-binding protein [Streptosporangiaceae bacterium]|jgi:hypothetical protein
MSQPAFPPPINGSPNLTFAQVLRLPASVDLTTAAHALGFGRTKAYALARNGTFPCRVIRVGEVYRVPTAELLALLGIDIASLRAAARTDGQSTAKNGGHHA